MAVKQEEKDLQIKKLKDTIRQMGDYLQSNNFEEAYQLSGELKTILASDVFQELTRKEASELRIEEIEKQLKRYYYNNRQMRMYAGGLRKNGETMLELVN